MKRIFELTTKDIEALDAKMLKGIIQNSEGRTVVSETIISYTPFIKDVSNPELAASFGADMITLNTFNFERPFIFGVDDTGIDLLGGVESYTQAIPDRITQNLNNPNYIKDLRRLVGRLIGVNLEPVPDGTDYPKGYTLSEENLKKAKACGFDYIVITANPGTGVTAEGIIEGIKLAKAVLGDQTLIIAGKMHGAGAGNLYEVGIVEDFVTAGADVVLVPAPGTVPGFDQNFVKAMIDTIHQAGALAMTTIGTSQEGASESIIEQIALMSKMAGADLQHIGDCGTFGMALPENIMKLSVTIRGVRHTYRRMGHSINR